MTEFFMAMIPPTSTKQARGWHQAADGKVISYDRANANAEGKLTAHLAKHIPQKPYTGAIRVLVKWLFPLRGQHKGRRMVHEQARCRQPLQSPLRHHDKARLLEG